MKESERVRATCPLETAEERTWKEGELMGTRAGDRRGSTDRKRWSEGDSPSGDGRRKEGVPNA